MIQVSYSSFIPHYIAIFLILLATAGFFYTRHRLVEYTDVQLDRESAPIFEDVPDGQRMLRNVGRWHDSSLIFATLESFRAENGGGLPASWGEINDSLDDLFYTDFSDRFNETAGGVKIQNPPVGGDLPSGNNFHIWPGYACAGETHDGYRVAVAELTYGKVIERGTDSDFAIVYGAEAPDSLGLDLADESKAGLIKCLDSVGGYDDPDFVFRMFQVDALNWKDDA